MFSRKGLRFIIRVVAILSLLTAFAFAVQPVGAQGPPEMDVFKYNDLNGSGTLDTGEPGLDGWEFTVEGPANGFGPGISTFSGNTSNGGHLLFTVFESGLYTVTETLKANWDNTDPGGTAPFQKTFFIPEIIPNQFPDDNQILFGNMQLAPNSMVTIDTNPTGPLAFGGGRVTLVVAETNTGQLRLSSPHVGVTSNAAAPYASFDLTKTGAGNPAGTSFGGDTNDDGFLDPGETWTWTLTNVPVTVTSTFVATGAGTDPTGINVTYPDYPTERDTVRIVVNPITVPGISTMGLALLILTLGGLAAFVTYRKSRSAQTL